MIDASTIAFLKELSENNNREWFNANKARYETARNNIFDFTAEFITGLSKVDRTIPADLPPKDCVMRIYRDIRFSNDKTPLKINFGIAISANGKNFKGPGYYVHVQPGKSFIAGGSWFPEAEELKAIRQEIDYNGSALREVTRSASFKKFFGDLDREAALKTTPKGYSADHEDIEYLKLKSFTATHSITDKSLQQPGSVKSLLEAFQNLYPLIVFLRNAIA